MPSLTDLSVQQTGLQTQAAAVTASETGMSLPAVPIQARTDELAETGKRSDQAFLPTLPPAQPDKVSPTQFRTEGNRGESINTTVVPFKPVQKMKEPGRPESAKISFPILTQPVQRTLVSKKEVEDVKKEKNADPSMDSIWSTEIARRLYAENDQDIRNKVHRLHSLDVHIVITGYDQLVDDIKQGKYNGLLSASERESPKDVKYDPPSRLPELTAISKKMQELTPVIALAQEKPPDLKEHTKRINDHLGLFYKNTSAGVFKSRTGNWERADGYIKEIYTAGITDLASYYATLTSKMMLVEIAINEPETGKENTEQIRADNATRMQGYDAWRSKLLTILDMATLEAEVRQITLQNDKRGTAYDDKDVMPINASPGISTEKTPLGKLPTNTYAQINASLRGKDKDINNKKSALLNSAMIMRHYKMGQYPSQPKNYQFGNSGNKRIKRLSTTLFDGQTIPKQALKKGDQFTDKGWSFFGEASKNTDAKTLSEKDRRAQRDKKYEESQKAKLAAKNGKQQENAKADDKEKADPKKDDGTYVLYTILTRAVAYKNELFGSHESGGVEFVTLPGSTFVFDGMNEDGSLNFTQVS